MNWFPCLVLLVKENIELVAKTVNDIPNGTTFRVLKTQYSEE
jgi:hypothetical protein